MDARYLRNFPALTEREQRSLAEKRALIVGCGGLGGYLAEYLARLGVGRLTLVDGDRFAESNLNRQLLCTPDTIGRSKAEVARERVIRINPTAEARAVDAFFSAQNAAALVADQDVALDALDTPSARLLLEDACAAAAIPLVHGAVDGWTAQVGVSMPGSGLLRRIYGDRPAARQPSGLAFTPALCAALQAAEALKLLCGREPELADKLLVIDLQAMDAHTIKYEIV